MTLLTGFINLGWNAAVMRNAATDENKIFGTNQVGDVFLYDSRVIHWYAAPCRHDMSMGHSEG